MGYIDLIPDVFRLTMPDLATGKSYHTQKFNVGNKQCIGVTIKASQALSVAVAYGIATDTAAAAGVDIAASLPYKTSATSFASNTSTEGGTYHEIAVPPHARQAQLVISNASGSTVSGAVIDAALRVVAYPAASGSGSSDFASITGWPGSSSQFVHADGSYSPLSAADIPDHSADKLTSGTIPAARLPGVLADVDTQAELLSAAAAAAASHTHAQSDVTNLVTDLAAKLAFGLITKSGADGNVTISSGTTTLSRDMFYDTLTLSSTGILDPNGWKIYANKIVISGTAKIMGDGNAGSGTTGGTATAAGALPVGSGGGAGTVGVSGAGSAGSNSGNLSSLSNYGNGARGGTGGNGGTGTNGRGLGGSPGTIGNSHFLQTLESNFYSFSAANTSPMAVNAGSGGGGGGAGGGNGTSNGGSGGGGGASGRLLAIYCGELDISGASAGCISAKGGAGAAGTAGAGASNTGGGGGGAGGGGGYIYLVVGKVTGTLSGAVVATGGAGGNAGNGTTSANGGTGGDGGNGGNIDYYNATTNAWTAVRGSNGTAGGVNSGSTAGTGSAGGACSLSL